MRDLFSMGVFDDDDRKPSPRAARCLEEELLPPVAPVPRCARCDANSPRVGKKLCWLCDREVGYHRRTAINTGVQRLARRARAAGYVDTKGKSLALIGECLRDGRFRRASPRDLTRLGLSGDSIVLMWVGDG